jgi:hypothetical protein
MSKRKGKMHLPDIDLVDADWVGKPEAIHAVKYDLIDGEVVETKAGRCYPLPEQKVYAESLVRFLNKEIAFNKGRWRCVWTQPAQEYYNRMTGLIQVGVPEILECQYLDKDGDVITLVEIEENAWDLLDNFAFSDVAGMCNAAYEQAMDILKIVDPKIDQMYSPAHGQVESKPNEIIPDLF